MSQAGFWDSSEKAQATVAELKGVNAVLKPLDEAALVKGLVAGEIAGAGLDVYEHEPTLHPKLPTLPNVVLLPHMGSATLEARVAMGEKVIVNIKTFADGHTPPDRVIEGLL